MQAAQTTRRALLQVRTASRTSAVQTRTLRSAGAGAVLLIAASVWSCAESERRPVAPVRAAQEASEAAPDAEPYVPPEEQPRREQSDQTPSTKPAPR